jgi:hypothetical protein
MRLCGDMEERALNRLAFTDYCWEWTGRRDANGYGCLRLKGRYIRAHRAMMEWILGRSLRREEVVDHLCRNPACARPSHLEVVTAASNTQRGSVAKIDQEKARLIRAGRMAGRTFADLGAEFGIHGSEALRVCSGERWKP